MGDNSLIFFLSELIGVVAFSIAGTLSALRRELDILGAMIIGCVTAVGGGLTRDIILGINPPSMFINPVYTATAAGASALTLIAAYLVKRFRVRMPKDSDEIINIFDALGLGVFVTVGVDTVAQRGYSQNAFLAIFIGTVTCIGGGMMRDIMLGSIPMVLRKQVYAVPCTLGAVIYYYGKPVLHETPAVIITVIFVITVRVLAAHFRWDLPKIRMDSRK